MEEVTFVLSEKWVPLQVEIKTTTTDEKLASHYQVDDFLETRVMRPCARLLRARFS